MNVAEGKIPEIENPQLWRLIVGISKHIVSVLGQSRTDDGSLFRFDVALNPEAPTRLRAIEDVVYAVPGLLSDFGSVDIVMQTDAYVPVPHGLTGAARAQCAAMAHIMDEGDTLEFDEVPYADADILWAMPSDILGFLARTFRNPRVVCHMTPLLRYFSRKTYLGNSGKLYVHLRGGADAGVDLISFDGGLRICSSQRVTGNDDAAYFALAGLEASGLSREEDEILLCGDAGMRDAVSTILRRYAASVMPVIFPSVAFRAGREALRAPFPLVIFPLCE